MTPIERLGHLSDLSRLLEFVVGHALGHPQVEDERLVTAEDVGELATVLRQIAREDAID